ncbi:MAG: ArsR family transcriptional regulator [Aeromicrobium sp.]|nr:ArsR family transcriptional regulator [Aeromicrobium sp.]
MACVFILTRANRSVKLDSMNVERTALERRAVRHGVLADVARLAVIDELALGDRSPSELQTIIGLPSNLLAHHLNVLEEAGMVARRRSEGDRRRTYLTLADPTVVEDVTTTISADRVLFVCTANSARSQLAAAIWAGLTDVAVTSAGTKPAEHVAPGAVATADRHHLRLLSPQPRQFADVATDRDLVVAVCDNAYEELTSRIDVHWSVPDPIRADSDEAFEAAYVELNRRVVGLIPRLAAS